MVLSFVVACIVNMEQKLNLVKPHKLLTTLTAVPDIVYHSMRRTGMGTTPLASYDALIHSTLPVCQWFIKQ